ncbi:MAG: Ig-like domain-containing protein [Bacilli bacterium]
MNKKSNIIPFSILTMLLVVGSGVLSSCSEPSTTITPITIPSTTAPIVKVSSVTIDKEEVSLDEKTTIELIATVLPENALNKSVFWSSSDISVATVSDTGLVTAKQAGTAIVTASVGKIAATCTVTVTVPIAISGAKEIYAIAEPMIVSLGITALDGTLKTYADVNLLTGANKPEGAIIEGFNTAINGKKTGTIKIGKQIATINYAVYQGVDSEATLRDLVESKTEKTPIVIGVTKDMVIAKQFDVTRPLILYGIPNETDQNISIESDSEKTRADRIFSFDASLEGCEGLKNSTVEFHNITMEIRHSSLQSLRTNLFNKCDAINVVYDNAIVNAPHNYAISDILNDGAHYIIKNNSIISGFNPINIWSSNATFDIEDSTVIGTNNKTGAYSNFAAIVVNQASEKYKVKNNVINIKNSAINAVLNTEALQFCIDLRNETAKVNFFGNSTLSIVKKDPTNITPCYIRGMDEKQITCIDGLMTPDLPPLKLFMTRGEVENIIAGN